MGHYASEIDPQWEMDDEERRKHRMPTLFDAN
jgi:hypothetical protein